MGLFLRVALFVLALSALALTTRPAHAYGFMIRHGYGGCTTCHTDPSGGETLTRYGRAQSDLLLRMRYGKAEASAPPALASGSFDGFDDFDETASPKQTPAPAPAAEEDAAGPSRSSGFLWGLFDEPDFVSLGGSLRSASTLKSGEFRWFPMQADFYGQLAFGPLHVGGSLGAVKTRAGSSHGRAALVTRGDDGQLNLVSRTHWLGLDLDSRREVLLRAGRLNVPFGLRISEHVMWVREATRTDRESDQQHGVALAYSGDAVRGEVMAIAGNYQLTPDRYRERGYSLYLEGFASSSLAVGASHLFTVAQADRLSLEQGETLRGAHGLFARWSPLRPLVVMAEANGLKSSRRDLGYVGFVQADYELTQGLHLGATGEALDAGRVRQTGPDQAKIPGAGEPRFGGWLTTTWYFLPHCDLRVDAIARQNADFMLMSQLHVFL
ncbi:MAG: hypothetical protein IT377_03425 [Polyangiaceae bacterium]|nr:hypothetical protein [Polyangiaceae bacterium]